MTSVTITTTTAATATATTAIAATTTPTTALSAPLPTVASVQNDPGEATCAVAPTDYQTHGRDW